jgi:hypothetical protein
MKGKFMELLARHGAGHAALGDMIRKGDALSSEVAAFLAGIDPAAREAALALIVEEVADKLASPGGANGKPSPELLEWARKTFDLEEFKAGVREVEETGGLRFEAFIGEIEERVKGRE